MFPAINCWAIFMASEAGQRAWPRVERILRNPGYIARTTSPRSGRQTHDICGIAFRPLCGLFSPHRVPRVPQNALHPGPHSPARAAGCKCRNSRAASRTPLEFLHFCEGQRPDLCQPRPTAWVRIQQIIKALKGRPNSAITLVECNFAGRRLRPPLQGLLFFRGLPRPLAWADIVRPFGAKKGEAFPGVRFADA